MIVIASIPYGVNKSQLVEKIANLIIEKKVPQLADVRDESTDEIRVVLELTSGANPEAAMAYLYKYSPLESTFAVNFTALVPVEGGPSRPEVLSLKQCLQHFLDFRYEVVQRRLQFERKNLKERIHILEGLVKIFDALDEALKIVRTSSGRSDAAEKLRKRFSLTETQSYAVVDMRIYQLSRTSIEDIRAELAAKEKRVAEIDQILKSKAKLEALVRSDLEKVAKQFGDSRKSKIVREVVQEEFSAADYVVKEDVYAIVTKDGWLKRIRQSNELSSTRIREGDEILRAHPISTVDSVAFVTNFGSIYVIDVVDFPSSSGYGSPIQTMLKFRDGERVIESFAVVWDLEAEEPEQASLLQTDYPYTLAEGEELLLVSAQGLGFIITMDALDGIKRNGKRIMKLREKDRLATVCHVEKKIALFTERGVGLVIKKSDVPVRAGAAVGVMLMNIRADDAVVSAVSYASKANLRVHQPSGKPKEIDTKELLEGRRGLKGRKVLARGDISRVELI